eukprot:gene12696-6894_t
MEVEVLFDFQKKNSNELSVKKGETILVISQHEAWYFGENNKKKRGYLPIEYTVLKKISKELAKERIQMTLKSNLLQFRFKKSMKKMRERSLLIQELIQSEQNYFDYLLCMKEIYMDVIIERNKNKKMNKINVEILFGNLDQIINLGKMLIDHFDNNENVILVFSKMIPFMKLYVVYVKNYENAVTLYSEKLKKDKEFLQLIKGGRSNSKAKGLELGALLSKPFQRIFSYKNIFDRLLELTPKCSFEYENVEKLVRETEKLVTFINEEKRQFENVQKISDLQKRISQTETWGNTGNTEEFSKTLLKRWRTYIRTQRLEISSKYTNGLKHWSDCYLASDSFFYYIENMKVQSIPLCFLNIISSSELYLSLEGFNEKIDVFFSNEEDLKNWKSCLKDSIEKEIQFSKLNHIENPYDLFEKFNLQFDGIFSIFELYGLELEEFKLKNEKIKELNDWNLNLKSKLNFDLNEILKLQSERKQKFFDLKKIKENQKIKEINQKLDFFENSFEKFRKLCRNDEDEFKKIFGGFYFNFQKLKEKYEIKFLSHSEDLKRQEIKTKMTKKFNQNFLIFSPEILNKLKMVDTDFFTTFSDLIDLIFKFDQEEYIYDLLYKNYDYSNQISILIEKVQIIEKEKEKLKFNLETTNQSLSDLRENYSILINKEKLNFEQINNEIGDLKEIENIKLRRELKEKDDRIKKLESILKLKEKSANSLSTSSNDLQIPKRSVKTSSLQTTQSNQKSLSPSIRITKPMNQSSHTKTSSMSKFNLQTRKSVSPSFKQNESTLKPKLFHAAIPKVHQSGKVQKIVQHYSKEPEKKTSIGKLNHDISIINSKPSRDSVDLMKYPFEIEKLKLELDSILKSDIDQSRILKEKEKISLESESLKEIEIYQKIFQKYQRENEILRDELKFYFVQLDSHLKSNIKYQQLLKFENEKSNENLVLIDALRKENLNLKLKIATLCCSLTDNELKDY